jgi:protein involved in polysaccharide export with SLBB domain
MAPRTTWLTALAVSCFLLASLARAGQAQAVGGDQQVLRAGDKLRVAVWRKAEYSGEFLVTADGVLEHPLYQHVQVVGVPLNQVRESLVAEIQKYENNPEIILEPTFRVGVGGEVRTPTLTWYPRSTTVAQAIALAGGPTERGRMNRVQLIREGRTSMLDLTSPSAGGDTLTVRSGDRIIVTRSTNLLGVVGVLASLTAAATSIAVLARSK